MADSVICSACRSSVEGDSLFCSECGAALTSTAQARPLLEPIVAGPAQAVAGLPPVAAEPAPDVAAPDVADLAAQAPAPLARAPAPLQPPARRSGLVTAGLTLAILGFVLGWVPFVGFLGLVGAVLGSVGLYRRPGAGTGMVVASWILGLLATTASIGWTYLIMTF